MTFYPRRHCNFRTVGEAIRRPAKGTVAQQGSTAGTDQPGRASQLLPETESIRQSEWKVSPIPQALQDRRVEITGPVDRKMVINALNSGAKCFMACFEDATSPTWTNLIEGQINLRDAVHHTIDFETNGKRYELKRSCGPHRTAEGASSGRETY